MILYIAGYGRSGSTVLDLKLGKRFGCVSLGEISSLYADANRYQSARCGCGSGYDECSLWGPLIRNGGFAEKVRMMRIYQTPMMLSAWLRVVSLIRNGFIPQRAAFLSVLRAPIQRAEEQYPGGIYVDSSKTTWFSVRRPLFLAELGYQVVIIHIRRPLKDVLASVRLGDNKVLMGDRKQEKLFRLPRAAFSYFFANSYASLLRFRFPYLQVSQVELRDNEDAVLKKVHDFLVQQGLDTYRRYEAAHVVSGNRLKFSYTGKKDKEG
ncbi:conserved hypothetical protein [Gammaproteobacteria bacterium]